MQCMLQRALDVLYARIARHRGRSTHSLSTSLVLIVRLKCPHRAISNHFNLRKHTTFARTARLCACKRPQTSCTVSRVNASQFLSVSIKKKKERRRGACLTVAVDSEEDVAHVTTGRSLRLLM